MRHSNLMAGLFAGLIVWGGSSCGTKKLAGSAADCEGVICTMNFAAVSVQIRDAKGYPALLDSTVSYSPAGVRVHKAKGNAAGIYTVTDDSYRKALAGRTEILRFSAYRNGREVLKEKFTVTADCCHVSKASGPDLLTLK